MPTTNIIVDFSPGDIGDTVYLTTNQAESCANLLLETPDVLTPATVVAAPTVEDDQMAADLDDVLPGQTSIYVFNVSGSGECASCSMQNMVYCKNPEITIEDYEKCTNQGQFYIDTGLDVTCTTFTITDIVTVLVPGGLANESAITILAYAGTWQILVTPSLLAPDETYTFTWTAQYVGCDGCVATDTFEIQMDPLADASFTLGALSCD